MSTYHAIVWMDQQQAHVLHFDREHIEAQKIKARSHHKHQGRDDSESGFFHAVSTALAGTHEVLLTGPGSAREAFRSWVEKHQPAAGKLIVGSVPSDHPTDNQLVAMARKYFLRFDGMAGDPKAA